MAVNIIIGFIVTGIKPQGDDYSKQESTDEQINGNAIADLRSESKIKGTGNGKLR
ncbi:MAG: hypothetical protein GPI98_15775 [Microcystis aeruginosa W13-13]|nr:hypothetical protein [Microcystis aeruginosa W13-13]